MRVDNAVIMAAGTSSRFAPLSYERHKGLTEVRGEILVERQIRQLLEAGVPEIYMVTGYKSEQFGYLPGKYGVHLIHNANYLVRNNNGSVWAAREVLGNSYLCSADNYFTENPFESEVTDSYYAAEWSEGPTDEWCMTEDGEGLISSVTVGGRSAWYMTGHAFWSEEFTRSFLSILEAEYDAPGTACKLWESLLMEHLDVLRMKVRKYGPGVINEFDTLDELRAFDASYITDTRSRVIKKLADELSVGESELTGFEPIRGDCAEATGFSFRCGDDRYTFLYEKGFAERRPHEDWE